VSRATDLAERLTATADAFAEYLAGLTPEQWRTRCGNHPTIRVGDEDENRPVGTVAHHIGVALPRQLAMLRAIVAGEEVPAPSRTGNAVHAQANPQPDQGETVALVRGNAAEAAAVIRGLSDEDLDRRGRIMLGEVSAAEAVERVFLGHITWHEGSIRATLGS
jgi:hypothetical protein